MSPLTTYFNASVRILTMNSSDVRFMGAEVDEVVRLSVLSLGCVACVNGVLGNVLIISTLLCQPALRTLHSLYIGNLALADLLISMYIMPFWLVDLSRGRHPVLNVAHCLANSLIAGVAFSASLLTLVVISINRYINVCHHALFVTTFTKKRTMLLCGLTWVLGFILCAPSLLESLINSSSGYSGQVRLCSSRLHEQRKHYYSRYFVICMLFLPSVIVGLCNLAIFRHWRSSKLRMAKWNTKPSARESFGRLPDVTTSRDDREDMSAGDSCNGYKSSQEAARHDSQWYSTLPVPEDLTTGGHKSEKDEIVSNSSIHQVTDSQLFEGRAAESVCADCNSTVEQIATDRSSECWPDDDIDEDRVSVSCGTPQKENVVSEAIKASTCSREAVSSLLAGERFVLKTARAEATKTQSAHTTLDQSSTTEGTTATADGSTRRRQRLHLSSSDIALMRSLLTVFVCCVLLYLPTGVAAIVEIYHQVSPEVSLWGVTCMFLNHCINWIVYGLMNRTFRDGYVKQLEWCCRCRSS